MQITLLGFLEQQKSKNYLTLEPIEAIHWGLETAELASKKDLSNKLSTKCPTQADFETFCQIDFLAEIW